MSTLRISVTCGPLGPGPARTPSVAPGGTVSWPLRSTTLTCRKASPDPSASSTKLNPLSGLYHLTTACTGGPEGGSNLWALNPDVEPVGTAIRTHAPSHHYGLGVVFTSQALDLKCIEGTVQETASIKRH